ncbi:YfdX family protein [Gluconobacter morbifer]|uniref:YfdX protein n=1 Tax=Gluconobacter morbifer G707 TaxID=1088869 RepID=G6XLS0_9PROT|nr:YfdX family protein [Gluconobacter morbifer]EHH67325.1 hypothetical protein GMO_23190 [Gluconobacter morbifer G707]
MRLLPLAALALLVSAPAFAQPSKLRTDWEKFKAHRAFHHLSADGQKAFTDILKARDILQSGQTDAAIPLLYDAQKRLAAAQKADGKFQAAESDLHPAPQHPLSSNHTPTTGQMDWLPVGGEFIVSETVAPEKKAAVATANAQLKTGNTNQAAQTMQVVGEDATFIVALAPLPPTTGAVNRATVFTEGRQPQQAVSALNDVLDSLVFVTEDAVATPASAPAQPAPPQK